MLIDNPFNKIDLLIHQIIFNQIRQPTYIGFHF